MLSGMVLVRVALSCFMCMFIALCSSQQIGCPGKLLVFYNLSYLDLHLN